MTTPGHRYLRGHYRRKTRRLDIEDMGKRVAPETEVDLEPIIIVSRCLRCQWVSSPLELEQARAAYRAHVCTAG
jgi:hypothetical protein